MNFQEIVRFKNQHSIICIHRPIYEAKALNAPLCPSILLP